MKIEKQRDILCISFRVFRWCISLLYHWQIINYISATTDEETIDFMRYAQCILKRLRDFKP